MSKKKCRKLGNIATKADLKEEHRIKMEMRRALYEHNRQNLEPIPVRANLSWDHEFFDDTPSEHDKRKNNS